MSTAASAFFGQQVNIANAADIAPALAPVFGNLSAMCVAIGLFSVGISSAITAPLAAAFALSGILNLNKDLNAWSFKLIWFIILLLGVLIASSGYKPISVIWFAQVANGLLLPIVVVFLIWMLNKPTLKKHRNNLKQNILASLVLLVTILLSTRSLLVAFNFL